MNAGALRVRIERRLVVMSRFCDNQAQIQVEEQAQPPRERKKLQRRASQPPRRESEEAAAPTRVNAAHVLEAQLRNSGSIFASIREKLRLSLPQVATAAARR